MNTYEIVEIYLKKARKIKSGFFGRDVQLIEIKLMYTEALFVYNLSISFNDFENCLVKDSSSHLHHKSKRSKYHLFSRGGNEKQLPHYNKTSFRYKGEQKKQVDQNKKEWRSKKQFIYRYPLPKIKQILVNQAYRKERRDFKLSLKNNIEYLIPKKREYYNPWWWD